MASVFLTQPPSSSKRLSLENSEHRKCEVESECVWKSFFINKNLDSSVLLLKSDGTVLLFRKKKKRASCTLSVLFVHKVNLEGGWLAGSSISVGPSPQCLPWVPVPIHHLPCRVLRSLLRRAFTLLVAGFCLKLTRSPLAADSNLWCEVFSSVAVHSPRMLAVHGC